MKRTTALFLITSTLGLHMCCAQQLCALEHTLDAPSAFAQDNVLYAPQGVHIHVTDQQFSYGPVHILADTMRWNRFNDRMFFNGAVSVIHAQYSLRAQRLGYNIQTSTGEAWDVTLEFREGSQRIRLTCEHLSIHPDYFLCTGLNIDRGNGSVVNISASTIKIKRAHTPHAHRSGFTQNIDSLLITNTRIQAGSVPFFYLPFMYRDYRLDYPWTRYEFGQDNRRGAYVQARIGLDMPRIADVSSRLQYRNDHYELAGRGEGLESFWSHPQLGTGSFTWFQMQPEIDVIDSDGGFFDDGHFYNGLEGTRVARRSAIYRDIDHRLSYHGGAAALRWSDIPQSITETANEDLFRAHFMEDTMQNKPLARQGVTAAWGNEYFDVVYDQERQAMRDSDLTDRVHGIELSIAPLHLIGGVHLQALTHLEAFERTTYSDPLAPHSETWRVRSEISIGGAKWYDGYGFDYSAGLNILRFSNGIINDEDIDDSSAYVPFIDMGMKTRMQAQFANGLTHAFTPRLGIEYLGNIQGESLQNNAPDPVRRFSVGDSKDKLEDHKFFIHTDFENTLRTGSTAFTMSNIIRWATRTQDRLYRDENGDERTGTSPLYDIKSTITGSPSADFSLSATFNYDGLKSAWTTFDMTSEWQAHPRCNLTLTSTLIPSTSTDTEQWQHRPGIEINGNRYSMRSEIIMREEGDNIDGSLLEITRHMVEGDIGFSYARESDDTGKTIVSSIRLILTLSDF